MVAVKVRVDQEFYRLRRKAPDRLDRDLASGGRAPCVHNNEPVTLLEDNDVSLKRRVYAPRHPQIDTAEHGHSGRQSLSNAVEWVYLLLRR